MVPRRNDRTSREMSTFLVAIILFGVAAFGELPAVLLLNIAGLPGELIAGVSEPPAKTRLEPAKKNLVSGDTFLIASKK